VIRIHRPAEEPAELTAARAVALPGLRPSGPASRKELPGTYKVAHATLWAAQQFKCAYCEHREQSKRNDVEHFRPATSADRMPGSTLTHGYWWLAYTWENLLFSCRNCNQSPAKLDKFPLEEGSVALTPERPPPGDERPLLIDPATESAIEHLEYVEEHRPRAVSRWTVRARNGSRRGSETIRVCKLDRPDLITLYTLHVTKNLAGDREQLGSALETGDSATIRVAWQNYVRRHLQPSSVFAGLSYDVLATDVPAELRGAYGLVMPEL
jgi:uncharacterized protein (TIGR02646 family)